MPMDKFELAYCKSIINNKTTSTIYKSHLYFFFQAFCDVTTDVYDRDAPTKQNLLCHRQAVQEVMLNHPDLKDNPEELKQKIRHVDSFKILEEPSEPQASDESFSREFTKPRFAYVLPARRRHILVLDVSEGMNR